MKASEGGRESVSPETLYRERRTAWEKCVAEKTRHWLSEAHRPVGRWHPHGPQRTAVTRVTLWCGSLFSGSSLAVLTPGVLMAVDGQGQTGDTHMPRLSGDKSPKLWVGQPTAWDHRALATQVAATFSRSTL